MMHTIQNIRGVVACRVAPRDVAVAREATRVVKSRNAFSSTALSHLSSFQEKRSAESLSSKYICKPLICARPCVRSSLPIRHFTAQATSSQGLFNGTTQEKFLMKQAQVKFTDVSEIGNLDSTKRLVIAGKKDLLCTEAVLAMLPDDASRELWKAVVEDMRDANGGSSQAFVVAGPGGPRHLSAVVLPSKLSRHNCVAAPHALTAHISAATGSKDAAVILALEQPSHAFALGCAVARAFPVLDMTSTSPPKDGEKENESKPRDILVSFLTPGAADSTRVTAVTLKRCQLAADGIRLTQRLVDAPPVDMDTNRLVMECELVGASLPEVTVEVMRSAELQEAGMGGLVAVGAAAAREGREPAMVVLSYRPAALSSHAHNSVAWVGKGIVYDTGGLSLKVGGSMCGMKTDMGGAAAMLAAFRAAVLGGLQSCDLHLVMCIAENAIGPGAFRNDDVLAMHSGKTVEVNNTDAEGRLVLADGVSYAAKTFTPNVLVDMATLTGAQMVTTGKKHAAVMSDAHDLEIKAVQAGQACGDLAHPLLYCPEELMAEFTSPVADMKNSVKDRMNAQASCAGHFVGSHLPENWGSKAGGWLHVDMAGPSTFANGRATGYGVALLLELIGLGSETDQEWPPST